MLGRGNARRPRNRNQVSGGSRGREAAFPGPQPRIERRAILTTHMLDLPSELNLQARACDRQ